MEGRPLSGLGFQYRVLRPAPVGRSSLPLNTVIKRIDPNQLIHDSPKSLSTVSKPTNRRSHTDFLFSPVK
jgi:hypothetical protein